MPSFLSMAEHAMHPPPLPEAAQSAARFDPDFRKEYQHRCHQKPRAVAEVAIARKLAVRLYWMLRTQTPYGGQFTPRAA
jgi:hypothetical protein